MAKYIDPTSDAGFKLTFGREKCSEPVLIGLLNALLGTQDGTDEITEVTYLNTERQPEWKDGKGIRYDIMCETASKHRFIVEMQKAGQPRFIDRATFYVSRSIAEQGYRGKDEEEVEWNYELKPVIGVFLCNFHVRTLDKRPIVRVRPLDEDTHEPIGMKTRYIFVQLPFFDKDEEECGGWDEKWIYNIKNMGIRQEVAFRNSSEVFRRLAEVASMASLTPEERYYYEADLKNARDTINQIRGAFQEGEEKGREEERLKSIRLMHSFGIPFELIAAQYGLPLEEVVRIVGTHNE